MIGGDTLDQMIAVKVGEVIRFCMYFEMSEQEDMPMNSMNI